MSGRTQWWLFGLAAAGIALVALLPACSGADDGPTATTTVVIDSDGAYDDLKAILFLLNQPDVEIVAITMSGTGVAHCPEAATNMSSVLVRIGAPDIPIACGRATPLEGSNAAPDAWRDGADTLGGVDLPDPRPLSDLDAPALLVDTISGSGREVVLVALGPLTNVAEAIDAEPSLMENVEMLYLMGGAVDVGGNVMYANPNAEFNLWADPSAAKAVFETDVAITMLPLDATNAVPVTPRHYEVMAAHRDASDEAALLAEYLDAVPLVGGWYHWDEFAAVAVVDASIVTIEERNIAVVGGGLGETVEVAPPVGRPVRVAVDGDRQAFEDHFYEAIVGSTVPESPAWEPDATVTWDGSTCTYTGPDPLPDTMVVQVDNTADGPVGFLTGTYTPGATIADLEAVQATGVAGAVDFIQLEAQIFVPHGAHDVWVVEGGPDVTAVCFADITHIYELAGPVLPPA